MTTVARSYADLTAALYAQNQFAIKYDLEATREAVAALGLPAPARRTVLVGGTNGKGTAAATLNAIALTAGWRVGLYTSPHLVDFRERIRIDGDPIPVQACTDVGWDIFDRFSGRGRPPETARPLSYFELATLIAWSWFADHDLDLAIFEVGLGGRLDATNVVEPDVSVLTGVALDHQRWLGDTVDAIAREKVAIGRTGRPLVVHESAGGIEAIRTAAAGLGTSLVVTSGGRGPVGWNAALAGEAYRLLSGAHVVDGDMASLLRTGVARTRWPGRRQVVRVPGLHLLVDGAHNPAAMATVVPWIRRELARSGTLVAPIVFGVSHGRDPAPLVRALASVAARFIVTEPAHAPGVPAAEVAKAARETGVPTNIAEDPAAALALIDPDEPTVVTGSLYLAGELLAELGFTPETLEVYTKGSTHSAEVPTDSGGSSPEASRATPRSDRRVRGRSASDRTRSDR